MRIGFGIVAGFTLALLSMAAPLQANAAEAANTSVSAPWVRATPSGSTITAAFMEIKSETGDKLTSISTEAAGRAEVHTHVMEGDVMKMRRLDALEIAKGETRILKPMGDHIMLFDVKQPLKEGDVVKLTLTFEKAGPVNVEARVEPIGAAAPKDAKKQPSEQSDDAAGHHHHEGH